MTLSYPFHVSLFFSLCFAYFSLSEVLFHRRTDIVSIWSSQEVQPLQMFQNLGQWSTPGLNNRTFPEKMRQMESAGHIITLHIGSIMPITVYFSLAYMYLTRLYDLCELIFWSTVQALNKKYNLTIKFNQSWSNSTSYDIKLMGVVALALCFHAKNIKLLISLSSFQSKCQRQCLLCVYCLSLFSHTLVPRCCLSQAWLLKAPHINISSAQMTPNKIYQLNANMLLSSC